MVKDLRTSSLIDMKNNLSQSIDCLSHTLEIIKSSLDVRASLISCDSAADVGYNYQDSISDPEHYYYFKVLNKAVSITYSTFYFNPDEHKLSRGKFSYHIKCYNWCPSWFDECTKQNSIIDDLPFGQYFTLEEAMKNFPRFVIELLHDSLGFNLQEEL